MERGANYIFPSNKSIIINIKLFRHRLIITLQVQNTFGSNLGTVKKQFVSKDIDRHTFWLSLCAFNLFDML